MTDRDDLLSRIASALERIAPPAPAVPDFDAADAFVWSASRRNLNPVKKVNRVELPLLKGIDRVRDQLAANTERFAQGLPANNALLWGARGMGKSSLVKAVHADIVARGALWPQAALSAGYDYARPNARYVPSRDQWDDSWDVTLSLSLDLWNGGKTSGEIRTARGEANATRAELSDFDRRLEREVATRARRLETAIAAARVTESAVLSARESLRVSQDRYHAGVINSSELLDAETSLLRAELERTAALARVHVATVALDRVVGR